ncbi:MAG: hypothetical protein O3A36_02480 [bacterium]|nr:hypothetical protein [bacterium]
MESEPTQHTTLIVFGGALLAAVVIATIVYFLPSSNPDFAEDLDTPTPNVPLQEIISLKNFDLSVLERTEYKNLDNSLFTRGLLPVTPPTGTGKTNLFQ